MKYTELADDTEDAEHSPAERIAAASRSTWVSVGVNLVLTISQIAIGIVSKSQGLIADGIHSLSDLVADFVVLFASHHSKKDADDDHPYGHQRFETAASLVLGTVAAGRGPGHAVVGVPQAGRPETVADRAHVAALWVAGGALVAKELLFRYMLAVAKRVKSSMLVANAWHARSDAASSLVVGVGIIGNLAGLPDPRPDRGADRRLHGHQDGLELRLGCAARPDGSRGRRAGGRRHPPDAAETPGVSGVHDVRTRKMGDMIVVDAHIEVDADITVEPGTTSRSRLASACCSATGC
jgi:divalent metal cation (Fe/Co/Zn/Cd) transporter